MVNYQGYFFIEEFPSLRVRIPPRTNGISLFKVQRHSDYGQRYHLISCQAENEFNIIVLNNTVFWRYRYPDNNFNYFGTIFPCGGEWKELSPTIVTAMLNIINPSNYGYFGHPETFLLLYGK